VKWPGRAQIIESRDTQWLLDGAHTAESLAACGEWLQSLPSQETCMIFNCTGGRNVMDLLGPLAKFYSKDAGVFKRVVFCTNETFAEEAVVSAPDLTNKSTPCDSGLHAQHQLANAWKELIKDDAGCQIDVVRSVQQSIDLLAGQGKRVLVTGSLHLIGGVLTVLKAEVE